MVLGGAVGALFGALVLWALIAAIVVPRETSTAARLAAARDAIETAYRDTGELPRPDEGGHLRIALAGGPVSVVDDGFGRALAYRVSGKWKLASWTLTSAGFDGAPSADDLCLSGGTKLMQWVDKAAALGAALPSYADRLAQVRALRCPAR